MADDYETIAYEKRGARVRITLNRPHILNAAAMTGARELETVARRVEADEDVRIVTIMGAGRAFCTGIDLKDLSTGKIDDSYFELWDRALRRFETMDALVLCLIHGYAVGGGLQLALAADIRVCTPSAKLGLPAIKEGLIPGLGTLRLARYIGLGRAKRLIISGDMIDGAEGERIGLVDHLVDEDKAEAAFEDIVARYEAVNSEGCRFSKRLLADCFERNFEDFFATYMDLQKRATAGPDFREAMTAYREKRDPQWSSSAATAAVKPYDRIESASRDEITALQIERLKWTLRHAYGNVATYRKKFDAAGVHPDDFRDLGDLARFPATTKDDLRLAYPYGMFAVPRERIVRVHASSGTTGTATVAGYTQGDIDTWAGLMARTMHAHGGRAGDIVLISYGYGLFTGGLGAHYGAERLGCMVIPASGGQTERQARLIRDLQPAVLMATPSYALNIAEELDRQTGDAAAASLRIGCLGAEPWSQAMRVEIERRLGIEALDLYGLSEVMGPGVAAECAETKDGLTIWEDHFYPEVIDPETGASVPDGTAGELVLTTLTKEALPLIRYRTRDLTRLLPPSARTMRRIASIGGRSDDMLIVRGVNLFPSQIEALVLDDPRLAPHYVIEASRNGALDALLVRVEWRESEAAGDPETAAPELARRIKDLLGVSATVRVEARGTIERSAGKADRVIDHRAG